MFRGQLLRWEAPSRSIASGGVGWGELPFSKWSNTARAIFDVSTWAAFSSVQLWSLLSRVSTHRAIGPLGASMIPAAVRTAATDPVLCATFVPAGSNLGIRLSSQVRK
jgi:hypothetical protein